MKLDCAVNVGDSCEVLPAIPQGTYTAVCKVVSTALSKSSGKPMLTLEWTITESHSPDVDLSSLQSCTIRDWLLFTDVTDKNYGNDLKKRATLCALLKIQGPTGQISEWPDDVEDFINSLNGGETTITVSWARDKRDGTMQSNVNYRLSFVTSPPVAHVATPSVASAKKKKRAE